MLWERAILGTCRKEAKPRVIKLTKNVMFSLHVPHFVQLGCKPVAVAVIGHVLPPIVYKSSANRKLRKGITRKLGLLAAWPQGLGGVGRSAS